MSPRRATFFSASPRGEVIDELWSAVVEGAAPLHDGAVRLELLELGEAQLPDPFRAALARDGDRAGFARSVAGFVRAFTEPSLVAGLDPGRPPAEREQLMDALYEDVRSRAERRPDDVRADWRVALLRVGKPA